jgi:hypothetical protein
MSNNQKFILKLVSCLYRNIQKHAKISKTRNRSNPESDSGIPESSQNIYNISTFVNTMFLTFQKLFNM